MIDVVGNSSNNVLNVVCQLFLYQIWYTNSRTSLVCKLTERAMKMVNLEEFCRLNRSENIQS